MISQMSLRDFFGKLDDFIKQKNDVKDSLTTEV